MCPSCPSSPCRSSTPDATTDAPTAIALLDPVLRRSQPATLLTSAARATPRGATMSTNEPPPEQPVPPPTGGYGEVPPPPPPTGGYGQVPPPPPPAPPAGGGGYSASAAWSYGWSKFTSNLGSILIAILVL